jgi:hypothetical protein
VIRKRNRLLKYSNEEGYPDGGAERRENIGKLPGL